MRDLWTRRCASLLLGGMFGIYTPESMRWLVLGVFLLLVLRIGLWKPRDFFGPSFRPEILILGLGLLVGIIYGMTGNLGMERPLLLNRVQVVGELMEWSTKDAEGTGTFKILDPISIPETALLAQENLQTSQGKATQAQEDDLTKKSLLNNLKNFFLNLSLNNRVPMDVQDKEYRLKVYPNSEGEPLEGWEKVQPGDVLRFTAKLEQPKPPGTPGQFDLPLYYAVRGLSGGLTAQGTAEIVTPGSPSLSWRVKTQVREVLNLLPSDQSGVLEGILFGDTSGIPEEDLERYRVTGVYHVFSASGSNVAFLLLLSWGVLGFLPLPLRAGLSIAVLSFYAILCGGNPPILRATVMGIFVLVGRLSSGRGNSLRGLFLASLLLFIWEPLIVKDIGFQLSFMATLGILVLGSKIRAAKVIRRFPNALKSTFAMTFAAQIATLPLLIVTFHRLSFIGLIANLGVLFIIGSVFELGMLGVILSFLPPLALPLFQVSLWLISVVNGLLFRLASLPLADAWVVNPGVPFWMCWYAGILVLLFGKDRVQFTAQVWGAHARRWLDPLVAPLSKDLKALKGCLPQVWSEKRLGKRSGKRLRIKGGRALLVFLVLLLLWSPWNIPRALEVTFIDVGQGDSILIETPEGKRILVDTGPLSQRFDAGERIIVPYLLQKGIKHLDALILTHSHADHFGGAAAVLETIPVDWVGVPEDGQDWLKEDNLGEMEDMKENSWGEVSGLNPRLIKLLASEKLEKLEAGDRLLLDSDIELKVLAPKGVLTGTHSDENNNSLVLRLANRSGQSVLLTADMEEEEMQEILESGQDFSSDLFKVPHHGSRFSLDLDMLNQINPRVSIISVGKNSFGHPAPGVLQYWQERQVPLYRTDVNGSIRVRLDEKGIEVLPGRN